MVAFEMEGAGVLDEMPAIVVEGLCDYADCRALRAAAPSRRADRSMPRRNVTCCKKLLGSAAIIQPLKPEATPPVRLCKGTRNVTDSQTPV